MKSIFRSSILVAILLLVAFRSPAKVKVVMFGDSITKMGNWNELFKRDDVINRGFPGFTTSHLVWLIHDNVVALHPEICFLQGGINDIGVGIPLGRIKKNYTSLIDTLLANKITPVVQSTLYQVDNPQSKVMVDSLNHFLVTFCKIRQVHFLDINSKLSAVEGLRPEYSKDGTHINEEAYQIWGKEINDCIKLISQTKQLSSFLPGQIWDDTNGVPVNAHGGGVLFHKGNYYWYGEHKVEGALGNTAQVGVHVYSSKDLYNWTDRGTALKVSEDPKCDIAKGCVMERPKVIYNQKTKKFVMWFHLELKDQGYNAARSGVAVSDYPTGPFTFIRSFRPNAGYWPVNVQKFHKLPVSDTIKSGYCGGKGCLPAHPDTLNILGRDFKGGQMARDMNLFVDDDGKAYQIYSSEENSTLHISQLTDDYLTYSGKYGRFFSNRYMEGAAMFKTIEGKYYLIASDCTGWTPNSARSAVAESIWGPWKELGNPSIGKDSLTTFHSQSTYILSVSGKKNSFIYMGDRWEPNNAIDGRYVWLPLEFEGGRPTLKWYDEWDFKNPLQNKK